MTPKRLGVWILTLFAIWSLVGSGGSFLSEKSPGLNGVGLAQAGDPDQYTNDPLNNPGGDGDSTTTPPGPASDGGTGGSKTSTLNTLLTVVSVVLWGSSATFCY